MVLKPLGILGEFQCALRSLQVLDVHHRFPGGLASERVVVVLDETVDEVHGSRRVLQPFDIVLVPKPEVTAAVVRNQG